MNSMLDIIFEKYILNYYDAKVLKYKIYSMFNKICNKKMELKNISKYIINIILLKKKILI